MTHSELCAAIVIIGGERFAMDQVTQEQTDYLATLGLVCYEDNGWWLTRAGEKLLPDLIDGNEIPRLCVADLHCVGS